MPVYGHENTLTINMLSVNNNLATTDTDRSIDHFVKCLLPENHLPHFQSIIDSNERIEDYKFNGFTDTDMIYYFVHRKTNDDEMLNRKESTKSDYLRELFQFYCKLKESESYLQSDVLGFQEGELLKNVKPRHIRLYQTWLVKDANGGKGYKKSARAKKIRIIKSFLMWLYHNQYIAYPLFAEFTKATVTKKDRPKRDLNDHEVKQLLEFYKQHPINHAILSLLASTGLRINAIATAKWSDLSYNSSFNGGTYYLKVNEKRDKVRHAVIHRPVFESIQRFRRRRGLDDKLNPNDPTPLFVTNQDKEYGVKYLSNYVIQMIKKTEYDWLQQKDGNVSPHWLRHFFVNQSRKFGADLTDIQLTVQHESRTTTELYVKDDLEREKDVALLWDTKMFELD